MCLQTSTFNDMPLIPGLSEDHSLLSPTITKATDCQMKVSRSNHPLSPNKINYNQENILNEAFSSSPNVSFLKSHGASVPSKHCTPMIKLLTSPPTTSSATKTDFLTPINGKRISFAIGKEPKTPKLSCRKILTFGQNNVLESQSKVLQPLNQPSICPCTIQACPQKTVRNGCSYENSLNTSHITVKRISQAEAQTKKNQLLSPLKPVFDSSHYPSGVMSSPCYEKRVQFDGDSSVFSNDCFGSMFNSDSRLNDFEQELLNFSSTISQPDISLNHSECQLTDVLQLLNQPKQPSPIEAVDWALYEKEFLPEDEEYINFLKKFKEPVESIPNPFVEFEEEEEGEEEEEESENDIYQDDVSSPSSEEDLNLYDDGESIENFIEESLILSDTKMKKLQKSRTSKQKETSLCNNLISERELFGLYEETMTSYRAEINEKKVRNSPHNYKTQHTGQIFSLEQIEQLQLQLSNHFQLLIQTTSLLMEGKLFDVMVCIKNYLQMLFELKYFKDLYDLKSVHHISSQMQQNSLSNISIFNLPALEKLPSFLALVKKSNQDLTFAFNPPSRVRIIPESYSATKQLMYSRIDTNQLFIPSLLQRVLILFNDDFDSAIKISWGNTSKNASKNAINFSCEAKRCKFVVSEDELLLLGLKRYCLNWEVIHNKMLPSKTPRQIAIRYKNLTSRRAPPNPIKEFHFNLAKPLDEHEEELLYGGVQSLGKDFLKISKMYLPYRPAAFLRKVWTEMDQSRRIASPRSEFGCSEGIDRPAANIPKRSSSCIKREFSLEDAMDELMTKSEVKKEFDLEEEFFKFYEA